MGSLERSKKKSLLWKKATIHFSLCFVMGFFTGFAPTGNKSSLPIYSTQVATPQPMLVSHSSHQTIHSVSINESVEAEPKLKPRRLVILVTPTSTKLPFQAVFLRKLANTIKLVPQPLLWIVVEAQRESTEVSEILRKTGIMYRHLVFKENFTNLEAEMNHQRNLALKHIEHHRLSGIVHFAGLSNVYDLEFFNHLRDIEMFGTWPMALVKANRKRVKMEGPVCDSSQVIGWHLRTKNKEKATINPTIHISGFAFNSSILWDPERWGRVSSGQDTSQKSIKFVKQVVLEEEAKLKGIPPQDCSKILLWRLSFHARTTLKRQVLAIPSQGKRR
ncbi:putative beta-1,4-xylosyltransferase IRX9 [Senna tora]|uniref:Glycosyltransferases n=1 Tax=Senna tora TaxID=362788 RepID=A0A834TAH1_9FABA|nr:putative beta-1,4-xylosyltransferase IRX9 [Senna tora]